MDVITLLDILSEENARLLRDFMEVDANYAKASRHNDKNSMAYWWNREKQISDRMDEIANARAIVKEFSGEGLCV